MPEVVPSSAHSSPIATSKRWERGRFFPIALVGIGVLSVVPYTAALAQGQFRPGSILPFFPMFFAAFALYAVAIWLVLRLQAAESGSRQILAITFGFALVFNALLLPMRPTLSDDLYRYVWDGRVQANGINPYRYPSDASELAFLRDSAIWSHMNRLSAITLYPPGAQIAFALAWRIVPDSVLWTKVIMIAAELLSGLLLVKLLQQLGESPTRVLIFLWNPLLIFEIAHSGHVDALYLPLMVSALWLRATAPHERVSQWREGLIGVLIGIAALIKLYPALLAPPLWSLRDSAGKRRWRLALPIALAVTISTGYVLYFAPGVNLLGFLPSYAREFFNIAPLPQVLIDFAEAHNIAYYLPITILFPLVSGLLSLFFLLFPARTAREAIDRCAWPIAIYLLINMDLFSWYVLWMLPFVALNLRLWRIRFNGALAWWLFSALVALSYTLFITGYAQNWASWVEFIPVYLLLAVAGVVAFRTWQKWRTAEFLPNTIRAI